eukprot:8487894-Pyramimonas_sp.AAC.1
MATLKGDHPRRHATRITHGAQATATATSAKARPLQETPTTRARGVHGRRTHDSYWPTRRGSK